MSFRMGRVQLRIEGEKDLAEVNTSPTQDLKESTASKPNLAQASKKGWFKKCKEWFRFKRQSLDVS